MDKLKLKYIINVGLLISFVAVFVTGIIKFPGLLASLGIGRSGLPWAQISKVHDWSGLVMGILVFAHLVQNWSWMVATTKRYVLKRK